MSQNRHNGLFSRVRKTFDFLRSSGDVRGAARRIDPILKLNIAPIMGRRDAAVDRAANFIGSDLFSMHEDARLKQYSSIERLLNLALDDCDTIISGLSSQDTLKREKALKAFISMLHDMTVSIRDFAGLEHVILTGNHDFLRDLAAAQPAARLAESEKMLTGTEISLVNRLREFFDSTAPRLQRYREYARKSFSPVYAEKYAVAYKSYFDVYGRDDF